VKISRLKVQRFTAFEDAEFVFAPGVNVLIGENGTGKSHVLKLLYTLSEAVRRQHRGEGLDGLGPLATADFVKEMLRGVFLPEEIGRLVRRAPGRQAAEISLAWTNGASLEVEVGPGNSISTTLDGDFSGLQEAVFIPTREMLSIYPGFTAAWLKRESEFDRTYFELSKQLGLKLLRGARDEPRRALLEPLEQAIHARVRQENGRFYLKYEDGGDIEAPLAAEGHRKLAMLAYLIANGSLTANGFLFWDEPEASINPSLARTTGNVIFGLARLGLQNFVTTHDYVLASEASLQAGSDASATSARFFALGRAQGHVGVAVETGERLTDLERNPILDAFVELNVRERTALASASEDPR
jgi:energy-coupling factor transporter ATP-binding protein EcfA2